MNSDIEKPAFNGHFASFIPLNDLAEEALRSTRDNDLLDYHSQFIGETICSSEKNLHFILSLNQLPEYPHLGWRIGSGRNGLPNQGVDLLLAQGRTHGVTGIHARLLWRKDAAGFFLEALPKKMVLLNGEKLKDSYSVIPRKNMIAIGNCMFKVVYIELSSEDAEQYQTALRNFMEVYFMDKNSIIVPTPAENESSFGNWNIHYALGKGSFGSVFMVTHRTSGRPAAAKCLLKTKTSENAVGRELVMAKRIHNLPHKRIANIIEIFSMKRSLIDINRVRALLGESWDPATLDASIIVSEASPTSLDSIYKILMPKHSKYPGLKTTTTFFLHIVEAVCHLHENGICHRDINLKNILVDSFDPPCARLTDFGCATVEDIMKFDTPIGTLLYAAPEQVPGKTYTRAVDYWALGLVGCQLQGLRLEALGVERIMPSQGQLSRIHEVLQKPRLDGNTFVECTRQLLVVDPKKRLMAKDAIEPLQAYIKELEEGEERH